MRVPIGVEVSIDYGALGDKANWFKLTDHNRQPIGINYELIENTQRMANGMLRKYIVARKFKITTEWENLPTIDTDLVDYKPGLAGTTTSTTTVVPSSAQVTSTWTGMMGSFPGGHMTFYTESLPDMIGRVVTISGIPENQLDIAMKNGSYTVTSMQSPLKAKGTTSGSSAVVTLTERQALVAGSVDISVGILVQGNGVPDKTYVTEVNGNVIKLDKAVTLSNTPLVFGGIDKASFTVSTPENITSGISGVTGTFSYTPSHRIVYVQGDGANTKFTVASPSKDLPTVGQVITIYGATSSIYNGTYTVNAVGTSDFSVPIQLPNPAPALYDVNNPQVYWVPGTHSGAATSVVTVTVTNSHTAHGAAWIKAFYESNAFQPIWVKVRFAQETPVEYGIPDSTTYVDSLTGAQIFNAFMTSFNYDILKRRSYNRTSSLNSGFDLVNLKIEFTEI